MSAHEENTTALRATNLPLALALESRTDGADLHAVYDAVPVTSVNLTTAARDAAWAKLTKRLHDPSRAPFVDEVRAPLELVRDEDPEAAIGTSPASRQSATARPTVEDAPRAVTPRRTRQAALAASVLLSLAAGATWANGSAEFRVPAGGTPQSLRLADGSSVWLAPGTVFSVPRRLGWPSLVATRRRDVELDGEAFFDVQRDGREFAVRAEGMRVEVLGTRFAVRAPRGVVRGRVEVSEGRVAVVAGAARAVLAAGEAVAVNNGEVRRMKVADSHVATWRTGGLAALDEPLGEVLAELSRRYGVEIEPDRSVPLAPSVSLFYPTAPAVEIVLGDLCTAQGLAFEKTSRGYRIVQP